MERTRVLIALSDAQLRSRLRSMLLPHVNRIEVVGDAASAEDALSIVGSLAPDLVLLDVRFSDVDGHSPARAVKQQHPLTSIVLMTPNQEEEELFGAIRYGAAAYITYDIGGDELADVVERVKGGSYVIDDNVLANPAMASRVLNSFRELTAVNQKVKPLFAPLSPREKEVLEHAAKGRSNREIARAMTISEQTVKNHLTSVMRKLAVNDRTHAVVYALQQGWINVPDL